MIESDDDDLDALVDSLPRKLRDGVLRHLRGIREEEDDAPPLEPPVTSWRPPSERVVWVDPDTYTDEVRQAFDEVESEHGLDEFD